MNHQQTPFIPELLSPAGNFEKMECAFRFGADAVYLAGKRFGMRSAADNFSIPELEKAIFYAHSLGKKVYVALNVMPREGDFSDLVAYLAKLRDLSPDSVIVADLGVFSLCQRIIPRIPVHISTQAAVVNSYSCLKWYEMGARRVVLARELSLREIAEIRQNVPADLELEVFVHGSMCVSISGRCMLSEYFTGRDANRGECAQPCRWQYQFYEKTRPDDVLSCEIHPEGSYLFASKDLCMIEHLNELSEAGVSSIKIEGRMKSAYYTALVTNAYRIALNRLGSSCDNKDLLNELNFVSHREYCTGYYFDPEMMRTNFVAENGYLGDKSYLCQVESWDPNTRLAACRQKNKFYASDPLEFITPGSCGQSLRVDQMLDEEMREISSCPHPNMLFYLKTDAVLHAGDVIRRRT